MFYIFVRLDKTVMTAYLFVFQSSNKVGDPFHNILSYSHLDVYPTRECQEVYTK